MLVRGVPLELHPPGDYVSDTVRLSGDFYEAAILDEVWRRLWPTPPGGVIVDAGAMIGNHTVAWAISLPDMDVHAFEPSPANLPLLLRNAEPWANVHVHPMALSDREQLLQLEVDATNHGHTRAAAGGSLEVAAMPLDAFGLEDVRLLKLDVEGHEPQVLEGAAGTLELWHPLVVLEDWRGRPDALLPGYQLVAEWERAHQTFLYEWAG